MGVRVAFEGKMMTAKEYLRQYEYAVKRIHRLEEEYEAERLLIDAVRSVSDNDGMPHGSGISKPTEDKAIRLADKALRLVDAKREAIAVKQELFDFINSIDGDEGQILFRRYVQLQLWKDIAVDMGYTERAVYKIHERALRIVEQKRSL